jgi:hypothetical protein
VRSELTCEQTLCRFARVAPPNCCQQLTAARLPLPGLKPLCSPETNGIMPLAERSRRLVVSRGNRHAARTARARGLAAAEATYVRPTNPRNVAC